MTNQPILTDEIIIDHLDELCHRFRSEPALVERLQGLMRIISQRMKDNLTSLIGSVREHEPSSGDRLVPNPHQEAVVLRAERDAWQHACDDKDRVLEKVRQSRLAIAAERDALQAEIVTLRSQVNSLTADAEVITWERGVPRAQVAALAAERNVLKAENDKLRGEGAALIAQLESFRRMFERVIAERDALEARLRPAGENGIASSW